ISFGRDVRQLMNQAQFWQYGSIPVAKDAAVHQEAENNQHYDADLVGGTIEQHAHILESLSVKDIYEALLEHCWKESDWNMSYNRHLYDTKQSILFSKD